jgi:hypothetical protein
MKQFKSKKEVATNEEEFQDIFEIIEEEPRYTHCPRCGSETWQKLYTNKYGVDTHCDECKAETRH